MDTSSSSSGGTDASSGRASTVTSSSHACSSAPSMPPTPPGDVQDKMVGSHLDDEQLIKEEKKARAANTIAECKRRAILLRKRKSKAQMSAEERAKRAKDLNELLKASRFFSERLIEKTKALGRTGRDFDNQVLADAGIELIKQPKIMTGGTVRDYQLEGLTWMYEIFFQGLSGILADEMGLGKTIQVISLIAHLRAQEKFYGPHLIIAPLSTLSNWQKEFAKWTPSIPLLLYHGTPEERQAMVKHQIVPHYKDTRPTRDFPVVVTSYEIIIRDRPTLSRFDWAFIVVDEGHRLKNADARLFRDLQQFRSATRLLITGTPLQNNLKELWSLLHFLMPTIFVDFDSFSVWFDFDELKDEDGTEKFLCDERNHDVVEKIHHILQPLLLRRIKADVAQYLPKKREYVLFAPLTKEQTDLYKAISDKNVDSRAYLENKVLSRLSDQVRDASISRRTNGRHSSTAGNSPAAPKPSSGTSGKRKASTPSTRAREAKRVKSSPHVAAVPSRGQGRKSRRSKSSDETDEQLGKKDASSDDSPPSTLVDGSRGRSRRRPRPAARKSLKETDETDDDALDDEEFEAMLAAELEAAEEDDDSPVDAKEAQRTATLEMAKKLITEKKLGNPIMQLRLVCNSPHNFYSPWMFDDQMDVDESIVTSSGKMLLLDRLLHELFRRGNRVLIFSQFKTQLDILHDYCVELRGWNVCRVDGGVAQTVRQEQIETFNNDPDYKIFLLSTRAGGQGINLASADTVILFDSDWNPQQDLQAQDRCHRIGQTRPVIVYRLATKGTVEESLLMSADAKRRLEKLVIKKGGFRTMGQKLNQNESFDKDVLSSVLLKDGEVYKHSGGDRILSDEDLDVLCDRSDEAYARAASGAGNADGFQVVATAADGIQLMKEEKDR